MTSEAHETNSTALEIEALEDLLDAAHMRLARMEQANDEGIPGAIVRRLVEGIPALTVWREHRALSREALAAAAGVPVALVAAIEAGKEEVPLQKISAIARALRIDVDDLVPWSDAASGH
jgi:DNA-binding Xre family transcriptional regulator